MVLVRTLSIIDDLDFEKVVEASIKKIWNSEKENLDPEKKFEILADLTSSVMRMKLELLLEEGYTINEAIKILRRMIEGEKPFR